MKVPGLCFIRTAARKSIRLLAIFLPSYRLHARNRRVVCCVHGGLGDRLMALPALRHINTRFYDYRVSVWFTGGSLPGICDEFDSVFTCRTLRSRFSLLLMCLTKPDVVFVNSTGIFSIFLELCALLSRASIRIGPETNDVRAKRLYTHPYKCDLRSHITAINVHAVDTTCSKARYGYHLNTFDTDKESTPAHAPRIGIHPGSHKHYAYKRWPFVNYVQLLTRINSLYTTEVLCFFGPDEKDLFVRARRECHHASLLYVHQLPRLFSSIARLNLLITNDTAYGHVAAALDIPVISIFGPTDPHVCAPVYRTGRGEVITAGSACSPCHQRSAGCTTPVCLSSISVDRVLSSVKRIIDLPSRQ